MNKFELIKRITLLKAELAELEEQVNRKKWKPIYNEKYWYVQGDGAVCSDWWINSHYDINSCTRGRIFRTQAEAEFFSERELVRAELEALADDDDKWNEDKSHWVVICVRGKIATNWHSISAYDVPYFATEQSAQSAIEQIGADRIKKYLFTEVSNA